MTDLRIAAQQALDYWEQVAWGDAVMVDKMGALRAALAQQAEPVQDLIPPESLFVCDQMGAHVTRVRLAQQAEPTRSQQMADAGFKPRDRRLECDECGGKFTAQMLPIHKCAQQAEPVEPVAWMYPDDYAGILKHQSRAEVFQKAWCNPAVCVPLYTTPPQRKPLPNHDQHCVDVPGYGLMAVRLVRAVERAHGIPMPDDENPSFG